MSLDRMGLEAAVDWTPFWANLTPYLQLCVLFHPYLRVTWSTQARSFSGGDLIGTGVPSPPAGLAVGFLTWLSPCPFDLLLF